MPSSSTPKIKQAAPQSLDDLVQAGYLKALPIDPMTHSNTTWVPDQSDSYSSVDQSQTGINDVHSGSDLVGSNGEPLFAMVTESERLTP